MTPEQERGAFAAKLLEIHGDAISAFIEKRASRFREAGDQKALTFWEDITEKLIQLMGPDDGSKPH